MKKEKIIHRQISMPYSIKNLSMLDGYYSGDSPNPNLLKFIKDHTHDRPYNIEQDDYHVPAFSKPIETTKANKIYNMHTYWSKKPFYAIRQYIEHYTKPGDLVLDPMCGSGSTALAALMEGRKACAIDLSPAATFITKNYCTPLDIDKLQDAIDDFINNINEEIDWLYGTLCDRCGGKSKIGYTIYSETYECSRCLKKIPLFDCIVEEGKTSTGRKKKIRVCPSCYKNNILEEINTKDKKYGSVPVLVSYLCENGCKPIRDNRRYNDSDKTKRMYFEKYDLKKIEEIDSKKIPYWYPTNRMMNAPEDEERWGLLWRPYLRGVTHVNHLYTKRNLWALSAILNAINKEKNAQNKDSLLFAFSSIVLINSKMCDAFNTQISKGTYYLPPIFKEIRPDRSILSKLKLIRKAELEKEIKNNELIISTQSCTSLNIHDDSIDYIFTDPPYSWKVQFGEVNFVWEAWLGFDTSWLKREIIVNDVRGISESDWSHLMRKAMDECHRVLKPGRWLSLCYHDTSEGTWELIQDIMAEVGFTVDKSEKAIFIDAGQKSWKQNVADKITKRDLIINFQKLRPGDVTKRVLIEKDEDNKTFQEKVKIIIDEYLESNPGTTKDRIYDEVVSRMVRKGEMEPHDFEEILNTVADEVREPRKKNLFEYEEPNLFGNHEISRWYLKESEIDIQDEAESAKEDNAAAQLSIFINNYFKKKPESLGVHYSDLFETFIYMIHDKPRRPLAEWLIDYFYKTENGTYRLPQSEEEEQLKAEGREKGTNRRIKRFLSLIEQGVAIIEKERPSESTLVDWIRHCKRSGLYEQGKFLYEKGGLNLNNLTDDIIVNVEEDYQVCMRMMERGKS